MQPEIRQTALTVQKLQQTMEAIRIEDGTSRDRERAWMD
jgi:hypothetical protein